MTTIKSSTTTTTAYSVEADTTGALVIQTGVTPTTALTVGSDQSVTFAGAVSLSGNQTTTGNLTVNGNTTLGDASTDTILMTGAPSIGGAGLGMGMGFRNRIINGGMGIAQRGTSFTSGANNDDAYVLDRFYILSDGNDAIDVTQTTTVPTGAKYSIGLDVETANKKFGIAQIIENANCFDAIGGNVTLSFQAKVSSTTKLDNVKCAIVAWSGTADAVTSDIISAWGAEGTNPTLIANATYENTPANLNVTTSFATYSVTANVDTASTANIIVFIWSDVTDTTAGDFLYITNVQLEKGSTATSFDYRPYGTELALCQRYFSKSFPATTAPAQNTGVYSVQFTMVSSGYGTYQSFYFSVTMRGTPTITGYNGGAANNLYRDIPGAVDITTLSITNESTTGFTSVCYGGGSDATGTRLGWNWSASAEL